MTHDSSPSRPLNGRIAVVCGATRGAGRGIAVALGEAGATVYCTGRSSRATGGPVAGVYRGRPERIEDTAALVSAAGGRGIALRVDHGAAAEVEGLADRLRADGGRLDLLVLDFWGDDAPVGFGTPFWEVPLAAARTTIDDTLWPHLLTLRALVPMMRRDDAAAPPPLVVEVAEGTSLSYRGHLFFDLAAITRLRLTYALAEELAPRGVAVVGVCPGYMRTEHALDAKGVTADTWRSAATADAGWPQSESPLFVGRAVAALAADAAVARRAGATFGSWELARDYGVVDRDGSRPDFGAWFQAHYGEAPVPPRGAVRWRVEPRSAGAGPGGTS